jgi:hypothetical protein
MRDSARYTSRIVCIALALPLAALTAFAASTGGCSSSSSPASEGPDAEAVCPDTLSAAIGAACMVDGLVCSPQYACGIALATAHCACTAGFFVCNDVEDAALTTPDAAPGCPEPPDAEACPKTEELASLAPCTETGRSCAYLNGCDATPAFDTCQCMLGSLPNGSTALRLECSGPCTYTGPPVDLDDGSALPEAAAVDQGAPGNTVTPDATASDAPSDSRSTEASE